MKAQLKLQDDVLNYVRQKGISVTIYLTNGFQMNGEVIGFDNFTIILKKQGKEQMIYKHAISTIEPQESVEDIIKESIGKKEQ